MPERTDLPTLLLAAGLVAGGLLLGLLLRGVCARLARRGGDAAVTWAALGWQLLKLLALPATVTAGLWWAAELLQLEDPAGEIVDQVLLAVIVLAVALAVANLAAGVVRTLMVARAGFNQSASIFVNITRLLVLVIGLLVVLQGFGISITPMLTALGVGGLAVALALQDTLANLFAGIQVLASKKVQPGDFIRLDSGEEGYVLDITWRNTSMRNLAENVVVIPNARLAGSIVTNFHKPRQATDVWFQVGVAYDSDLDQVERVTVETAREVMTTVTGGIPDYQPYLRFHTFGESSVDLTVILRVEEYVRQYLVIHEFVKRLHARYRAEGIQIPFPIRTVVMAAGAEPDGRPAGPAGGLARSAGDPAVPAARTAPTDRP